MEIAPSQNASIANSPCQHNADRATYSSKWRECLLLMHHGLRVHYARSLRVNPIVAVVFVYTVLSLTDPAVAASAAWSGQCESSASSQYFGWRELRTSAPNVLNEELVSCRAAVCSDIRMIPWTQPQSELHAQQHAARQGKHGTLVEAVN
jgi:hypothetical protein